MLRMVADVLFHPGHVVPAAKFVAAALKFANHAIAHVRVKIDAVARQIIVVGTVGHTDAGAEALDMLRAAHALDRFVKRAANAAVSTFHINIDGRFRAPVVGGAPDERAGVGVAKDVSLCFSDEIGVALQRVDNAAAKFVFAGHDGLKGNSCLTNVWRIKIEQRCCVVWRGDADGDV